MMLLAAADIPITSDLTGWSSIAASLVSTGFAVWYAWYMTTNRIPAIEKAHSDQIKEGEERHSAHIELLIGNFRADLKAMWDIKREDDKKLSDALDRLAEILRANSCKFLPGYQHADRP